MCFLRLLPALLLYPVLASPLIGFVEGDAQSQTYPRAQITNGIVTAEFYLPDKDKGFYRATRFDWSGIIRDLTYKGHHYFGQWYAHHDPLVHDAITGPVDVFDNGDPSSSFASATPGQPFLQIGVGVLEKPSEARYQNTHTYKILDGGQRTVRQGRDWIQFVQTVSGGNREGYVYQKTIRLQPNRAEMLISHRLRNTGAKPLETTVFNHGFFQLDSEPAGPNLVWDFPFEPVTTDDFNGAAKLDHHQISYLRELKDGERVLAALHGYSTSPRDNQFFLENRKSGAAVRVSVDQPIAKLTFWSRRMAYSPEASIRLAIPPGGSETWQIHYEFYTTKQ